MHCFDNIGDRGLTFSPLIGMFFTDDDAIQASLEVKSFTRIRLWQNNYIPVPWSFFEIILKGGSLVILKKVFAKFGRQFLDQSWKQSWSLT